MRSSRLATVCRIGARQDGPRAEEPARVHAAPPAPRLNTRAKERWPQLGGIQVRFRVGFAYVAGKLPSKEEPLPLCRLRFTGVLHTWGFARYLAGSGKYEENFLPTGLPFGSPEEAPDCACGLCLGDPRPDQRRELARGSTTYGSCRFVRFVR